MSGSSPLTRGKLLTRMVCVSLSGLIPAHAGKTEFVMVVRGKVWAHPRSRGENPLCSYSVLSSQGSSPLTRGKLNKH